MGIWGISQSNGSWDRSGPILILFSSLPLVVSLNRMEGIALIDPTDLDTAGI